MDMNVLKVSDMKACNILKMVNEILPCRCPELFKRHCKYKRETYYMVRE